MESTYKMDNEKAINIIKDSRIYKEIEELLKFDKDVEMKIFVDKKELKDSYYVKFDFIKEGSSICSMEGMLLDGELILHIFELTFIGVDSIGGFKGMEFMLIMRNFFVNNLQEVMNNDYEYER